MGKEKPHSVKTEWGLMPVRQSKACQHIMNCLSGKGVIPDSDSNSFVIKDTFAFIREFLPHFDNLLIESA